MYPWLGWNSSGVKRHVIGWAFTRNPRKASRKLKASPVVSISLYESTIRRILNNNGVHGRVARRKPLVSKRTWLLVSCYSLWSSRRFEDCSVDGWDKSRTSYLKWEGLCIWLKIAFQHKKLIPSMKHSCGRVTILGAPYIYIYRFEPQSPAWGAAILPAHYRAALDQDSLLIELFWVVQANSTGNSQCIYPQTKA